MALPSDIDLSPQTRPLRLRYSVHELRFCSTAAASYPCRSSAKPYLHEGGPLGVRHCEVTRHRATADKHYSRSFEGNRRRGARGAADSAEPPCAGGVAESTHSSSERVVSRRRACQGRSFSRLQSSASGMQRSILAEKRSNDGHVPSQHSRARTSQGPRPRRPNLVCSLAPLRSAKRNPQRSEACKLTSVSRASHYSMSAVGQLLNTESGLSFQAWRSGNVRSLHSRC